MPNCNPKFIPCKTKPKIPQLTCNHKINKEETNHENKILDQIHSVNIAKKMFTLYHQFALKKTLKYAQRKCELGG